MKQSRLAEISPCKPFHHIIEMLIQQLGVTSACCDQQGTASAFADQLASVILCQRPQPVDHIFEQTAIRPEEQRRCKHGHICPAEICVDSIHIVTLYAGVFLVLAAVQTADTAMDIQLTKINDRDRVPDRFCTLAE